MCFATVVALKERSSAEILGLGVFAADRRRWRLGLFLHAGRRGFFDHRSFELAMVLSVVFLSF
jgi:hypothetical protein